MHSKSSIIVFEDPAAQMYDCQKWQKEEEKQTDVSKSL